MSFFRTPDQPQNERNPAEGRAAELIEATAPLVDGANEQSWYERCDNPADRAVIALCQLRRAGSGHRGGPFAGDEAVRAALGNASPEAVIWLTSRLISFVDEQGFPETMERMFG